MKKVLGARALKTVVLTCIAVLSMAMLIQSPASAVGCTYGGCTGKDPDVQGCSADAKTVDSFVGHWKSNIGVDPYVELRHSNACHARWVRVTAGSSPGWGCGGGSQPQIRIQNFTSSGTLIASDVKDFSACSTGSWTLMVGRTSSSYRVRFGFREQGGSWCEDSYFYPCKYQQWP